MDLLNEVAEHRLGDVEVGDHPVFERADGADRSGRFAQHLLGHQTNRIAVAQNLVRPAPDSHHGRFVEDDPFTLDADKRVAGAQVDPHIDAEQAEE